MPHARLSLEAENDIDLIAAYTVATWGSRQASRYLDKLEDAFNLLAKNPSIGSSCETLYAGLHRFEVGSHVAFYLVEGHGVLIVRILHQSMLPAGRL